MSKTQGSESAGPTGLFAALSNTAATLLNMGRTRLELLANEIEEEKLRAMRLLLMALAMVFCLGVGIVLAVALLATLFWESRIIVFGGFAGIFLALGAVFFGAFKRATQRPAPVFAFSLAELEEDLRQLKAAARNESTAD
jgi:uncharacterized membrane protein YqjE